MADRTPPTPVRGPYTHDLANRLLAMSGDERYAWFSDHRDAVLDLLDLAIGIETFIETPTFGGEFPAHQDEFLPRLTETLNALGWLDD